MASSLGESPCSWIDFELVGEGAGSVIPLRFAFLLSRLEARPSFLSCLPKLDTPGGNCCERKGGSEKGAINCVGVEWLKTSEDGFLCAAILRSAGNGDVRRKKEIKRYQAPADAE